MGKDTTLLLPKLDVESLKRAVASELWPRQSSRRSLAMSKIKVVIVEDHQALREGLCLLLEREPDLSVVGEAGTGLQGADLVERLQPQVLLLDLKLPDLNGLEVLRQVRQRAPATRVLILSAYPDDTYVREACRQGAAGYCPKTAKAEDVIAAVRAVAAGGVSPPLTDRVLGGSAQEARATTEAYATLTTPEREVLQLAVEAHSDAEIAALLGISPGTVETHRATLMRTLNLQSHADLVQYVIRRGLIAPA